MHKDTKQLVWEPSSAGFTAESHLLSLERSFIIAFSVCLVNNFFTIDLTVQLKRKRMRGLSPPPDIQSAIR